MTKNFKRVRKTDYPRVVLTETCPYEAPIIFENIGVYSLLKILDGTCSTEHNLTKKFVEAILIKKNSEYTVPMLYKIRKDSESFRELSLLHPASQFEIVEFYKEFQHKILNMCSLSDFSIRAPKKIASKYYIKNNSELTNEFKNDKMTDINNELRYKHLTSYFSYSGYRRLYNFFDSYEFMRLERKFSIFWSLDISKCFDSIYTESINWPTQEKTFSKDNSDIKNTFGSVFNRLMKTSNHNDSSGIVIGPEVSRIFAEVIFQKIDSDIKENLERSLLISGEHYEIRRYVDDIYVFTMSNDVSYKVHSIIEKHIKKYKLSLNNSKTVRVSRPFVTKKTQIMLSIKSRLRRLEDSIADKSSETSRLQPKRIINKRSIVIAFANEIKSLCLDDSSSYTMACNFLIKALTNLTVKFCKHNKSKDHISNITNCTDFIVTIIDLSFHFFTVNPSHNGAIQLCKMATYICEFCDKIIPDESPFIKSQIYSRCTAFFKSSEFSKISRQYSETTLLETLNILIVSSCLGEDYLLSEKELIHILNLEQPRTMSYFEIIVLLYYTKQLPAYNKAHELIKSSIESILGDLSDLRKSTTKAYLLFEIIACPHIDIKTRNHYSKLALQHLNLSHALTYGYDSQLITQDLEKIKFCTSWDAAAMKSLLEKKALQRIY